MRALLALLAACGSPVAYDASIQWNTTEAPDVQSVRFDGEAIEPGFTFSDTFDSMDSPVTHDVEATTPDGVQTFQLVPSRCGGGCDNGEIDCNALTAEHDQWLFFHGVLGFQPPDPLEFGTESGSCTDGNKHLAWSS